MFDPFSAPSPSPRTRRGDGRRRASSRLDALAADPPLVVDDAEPWPDEPPWPEDPEAVRPDERPAGAVSVRPAPAASGPGRLVERWPPGDPGAWRRVRGALRGRSWVVLVVVGMVVAVGTAIGLLATRPEAEPAPALPPAVVAAPGAPAPSSSAAPTRLVISVVGRVARPGLVTVDSGARVADALRAAGGSAPGTDVTALNLARKVTDGEQIYVGIPVPPGASPPPIAGGAGVVGGDSGGGGAAGQKVDLNTATAEQLDELPGVGEVTAQSILDWRTEHGRFTSVGQLNEVDGIGEVRFGKLKDLVAVG